MKRATVKQGWVLAFGRYVNGLRRRGEYTAENAQPSEWRERQDAAEARRLTLCWSCDNERQPTADNCERCGADSTPF